MRLNLKRSELNECYKMIHHKDEKLRQISNLLIKKNLRNKITICFLRYSSLESFGDFVMKIRNLVTKVNAQDLLIIKKTKKTPMEYKKVLTEHDLEISNMDTDLTQSNNPTEELDRRVIENS